MSASSSITNHPQKTGELDWAILNATLALVAGKNASNTLRVVPAQQLSDSVMSGPESPMIATSKASTHQTEPQSKLRRSASPPRQDASVQDAQNALQTLFHSEYVVMGEYVECAIPVLYAAYLAFLYHLPTAAFYPHTRSLSPEKFARAVTNLLLYSIVEFASFTGLLITQVATLQGHLFLWISVILQMTLVSI
ncbi:hypothetical protein GN244_ATG01165 [Phytophthora infestans]|uniref:Transmembrane protein n=1 Tax=Phytophthora infestans TaxID=4787 RepID=A0A833TF71_PHYIN|nr:hypothetical protein GN244_ATG01165 [Phytophthora infestans]KAF4133486.1 hypothetical protein GN958_ATG17338 [Phytophthora infestans]